VFPPKIDPKQTQSQDGILMATPKPQSAPRDPFQAAMGSWDDDVLNLVKEALAVRRTRLAFQPIVLANDTGTIAFHEGLIRVLDSTGRVIPAAHFMPVISETELGREVDCVTLALAFDLLRQNAEQRLSINVSARSLGDGKWRDILRDGLAAPGALGERLIFEISESSAMQLHEVVIRFMAEVQPKGISFALDGFGAGMTAFRHLKDFFFDLVKIDKGFVNNIGRTPDNQVMAEALITVAHQFEMFVVADGVETQEDATFVSQLGADCLQGYHIGVPTLKI